MVSREWLGPPTPTFLRTMDTPHLLRARLQWVQLYLRTGHAGLTCRRCGISRPTLRK